MNMTFSELMLAFIFIQLTVAIVLLGDIAGKLA
jgi:hypothetical protein